MPFERKMANMALDAHIEKAQINEIGRAARMCAQAKKSNVIGAHVISVPLFEFPTPLVGRG